MLVLKATPKAKATFDPAKHPHAPVGGQGEFHGGQFVPKAESEKPTAPKVRQNAGQAKAAKTAAKATTKPAAKAPAKKTADAGVFDRTFRIHSSRIEEMREEFAGLNKKAAKLGLPAVTMTTLKTERIRDPKHPLVAHEWHTVRITGQEPVIAGHRFLGAIQHKGQANVLRALTGRFIPEKYRRADRKCDHCNTTRLRNDTYVLEHTETGKTVQVGKQCLKDYVGHGSPEAVAKYLEELGDWHAELGDAEKIVDPEDYLEGGSGNGRVRASIDVEGFLGHVANQIRLGGWVSSKMVSEGKGDHPTSQMAMSNLIGSMSPGAHYDKLTPADRKLAKDAITWLRKQPRKWGDGNEFKANVWASAQDEYMEGRDAGLMAAALNMYLRDTQQQLETKKAAEAGRASTPQGKEGERIDRLLTVTGIHSIDGDYGTTHIHSMVDNAGNRYKWFASGQKQPLAVALEVTGTVKGHNEYRGVVETVLTRCKVLPTEELVEGFFKLKAGFERKRKQLTGFYEGGDLWAKLKPGVDPAKVKKLEESYEALHQQVTDQATILGIHPWALDDATQKEALLAPLRKRQAAAAKAAAKAQKVAKSFRLVRVATADGRTILKAHVKGHTRTTKTGKVVTVTAHEDKRPQHRYKLMHRPYGAGTVPDVPHEMFHPRAGELFGGIHTHEPLSPYHVGHYSLQEYPEDFETIRPGQRRLDQFVGTLEWVTDGTARVVEARTTNPQYALGKEIEVHAEAWRTLAPDTPLNRRVYVDKDTETGYAGSPESQRVPSVPALDTAKEKAARDAYAAEWEAEKSAEKARMDAEFKDVVTPVVVAVYHAVNVEAAVDAQGYYHEHGVTKFLEKYAEYVPEVQKSLPRLGLRIRKAQKNLFDEEVHPHAPKGGRGKYRGGQFVPKKPPEPKDLDTMTAGELEIERLSLIRHAEEKGWLHRPPGRVGRVWTVPSGHHPEFDRVSRRLSDVHDAEAKLRKREKAAESRAARKAGQEGALLGRKQYPDGRMVPQVGDKVFQVIPGFMGTPATAHGEVVLGSTGLRVKITQTRSMIGSGDPVRQTQPLDGNWTVVGDPAIAKQRAAKDAQEAARKQAMEDAEAREQQAHRDRASAAVKAGKKLLSQVKPKVGMRVEQLDTGELGIMTEVGDDGTPFVRWDQEARQYGETSGGSLGSDLTHYAVSKVPLPEDLKPAVMSRKWAMERTETALKRLQSEQADAETNYSTTPEDVDRTLELYREDMEHAEVKLDPRVIKAHAAARKAAETAQVTIQHAEAAGKVIEHAMKVAGATSTAAKNAVHKRYQAAWEKGKLTGVLALARKEGVSERALARPQALLAVKGGK